MARKKVNLAWIVNDSTRKATFKKRKKGLMKKVSELVTLCDVKGCAIVYGPNDPRPEVWPSMAGAMEVLARFKSLPEMEQSKKTMNQEGFLRQQITKLHDRLQKDERDNRELRLKLMMHEGLAGRSLHDLGVEDTAGLVWMVESTMKVVQERIELVKREMMASRALEVGASTMNEEAATNAKNSTEMAMEAFQNQNWLMNEYMAFNGQEMIQPQPQYIDYPWPNTFFPFN